jgi:predicted PurR-regulated permease PerM
MTTAEIERPAKESAVDTADLRPNAGGGPAMAPSSLTVIRLVFLGLLLYAAATLLYPFSSILLWTTVLVVSLYPAYERMTAWLGGRRRVAALMLTVVSLLVLTLPSVWLAVTVAESVRAIYERIDFSSADLLTPPEAVKTWPMIGEEVHRLWTFAASNVGEILVKIGPQLKAVAGGLLRVSANAGLGAAAFIVSIVVAGFIFPAGPSLLRYVHAFARKLDPERGEHFVTLTGSTIRAVARGVVGISALQALLASIGFAGAGIPQASLLTFAVLILGIVQIGASVVVLPVIVWSWTLLDTTPAIVFTVYMLIVNMMDNVAKPFLLGRGLQVPMLAILLGVVGGALSYGLSGVFLGPIVLTVVWTLFTAWIDEPERAPNEP